MEQVREAINSWVETIGEDYFYNPDTMTDEQVADWKEQVGHEVYRIDDYDKFVDEVAENLSNDFSIEAITDVVRKAGYLIEE